MIIVVNRHHYNTPSSLENYFYIGRPHALSNPFHLNKAKDNREEVVIRFGKEVLRPALVARSGKVWDSLLSIAQLHADGQVVHLGCSCKRKKPEDREGCEDLMCHADAVKTAAEWICDRRHVRTPSDIQLDESGGELAVGDRVCHRNPLILDRRATDGDRTRRLGTIKMTAQTNPWDCVTGMIGVFWDDSSDRVETIPTKCLQRIK